MGLSGTDSVEEEVVEVELADQFLAAIMTEGVPRSRD